MKEAELGLFHLKIFILLCDNFPNKKKELNLRMIKLWKRNHRALFLFQFYSRIPPYSYPSLTKNVTTHCEIRTAFVKIKIYINTVEGIDNITTSFSFQFNSAFIFENGTYLSGIC